MENRTREIIETDSGTGMLFCANDFIGEVDYRYQITQEYISNQTPSGKEVTPGVLNLHGSFSTKSKIDLLGKELRIITTKGKELYITVMAGDPMVKIYIFTFGQSDLR